MAIRVGHIGLGSMGKAMATNELSAGFALTVFDLRDAPMMQQLFPVEYPEDLADSFHRRYNLTVKGE